MIRLRSRRFAASVIGFARRSRYDPYLRSEVGVIALQGAYALVILLFSVGALFVVYQHSIDGYTRALSAILTSPAPLSLPAKAAADLEQAQTRSVLWLSALIGAVSALFAVLITRAALRPTRQALQAQKRFLRDLAHELRTPLSIIRTNIEVRLLDGELPIEAEQAERENLSEIERITGTLDNMFSLGPLAVVDSAVAASDVDIGKIAHRVTARFAAFARSQSTRLRLRIAGGRASARGNATAIEQIISHILKNALQHTKHGDVIIRVRPSKYGFVELSISDTGSGIPREDLEHVFEPFYRGNRARSRGDDGGGSGLGLPIASELVKSHGGRIGVKSAVGVGTTVIVDLPSGSNLST